MNALFVSINCCYNNNSILPAKSVFNMKMILFNSF